MTVERVPVVLYGTMIGHLTREGSRAVLRWSAEAEQRWGLRSRVLSASLRVGEESADLSESFFGALLPEGEHIARLAREVKVDRGDLIGLLAEVGADLAGAVRISGAAADPRREPERLSAAEVSALLDRADGFLLGGGGSALPGFQRKLTLTRGDGGWIRGNGVLPSTHILKPVGPDARSAVEAEAYALAVARHAGLTTMDSWVEQIGARWVLVIERYDRRLVGTQIERLHQEDAAQALGIPWGGNEKFEENDSRVSLRAVAGLLDRGLARDTARHVAVQVDTAVGEHARAAFGVGVVQHRHRGAVRQKQVHHRRADAPGVCTPGDNGALAGQQCKRAVHHDFTSEQPPSFSGRNACSAGILRTRL